MRRDAIRPDVEIIITQKSTETKENSTAFSSHQSILSEMTVTLDSMMLTNVCE